MFKNSARYTFFCIFHDKASIYSSKPMKLRKAEFHPSKHQWFKGLMFPIFRISDIPPK